MTEGKKVWLGVLLAAASLVTYGVPRHAQAAEVAGVTLADSIRLGEGGETLLLNGAGVRRKFVVKVYVGGLYLREKRSTPEEIFNDEGPKRVVMHILHSKVDAASLADATNEGFRKNQSRQAMAALEGRLLRFNALFPDVRRGDLVEIDILPGRGTVVSVNGEKKGEVEGEDFARALLAVWLGAEPADKRLKRAFLGE